MLYINKHFVEFITFPNKERRLDLPQELLDEKPGNLNDVYWYYEMMNLFLNSSYWMTPSIHLVNFITYILVTCRIHVWIEYKIPVQLSHLTF